MSKLYWNGRSRPFFEGPSFCAVLFFETPFLGIPGWSGALRTNFFSPSRMMWVVGNHDLVRSVRSSSLVCVGRGYGGGHTSADARRKENTGLLCTKLWGGKNAYVKCVPCAEDGVPLAWLDVEVVLQCLRAVFWVAQFAGLTGVMEWQSGRVKNRE